MKATELSNEELKNESDVSPAQYKTVPPKKDM